MHSSIIFFIVALASLITIYLFKIRNSSYDIIRKRKYIANLIFLVICLLSSIILSFINQSVNHREYIIENVVHDAPKYNTSFFNPFPYTSSTTVLIALIGIISIIILVVFRKYWHVVIGATILSSITIISSLLTVEKLNINEIVLFKKHVIESQNYNIQKCENDLSKNIKKIKSLIFIDTITGFKSGSHEVPDSNWQEIGDKIRNSKAKFIILSGLSDPQKTKDIIKFTNLELAEKRAISVQEKIEGLDYVKNNHIPIFIVYDGVENGVKLLEEQIEMYKSERKVKIYAAIES